MLGPSPVTSVIGYTIITLTVANQAFVEQGIPHDMSGWIKFVTGIIVGVLGVVAKDANKSNAPVPSPESVTVK